MNLQYITSNPEVCNGKPIFKGTRIPVSLILQYLSEGVPSSTLLKNYPTLKDEFIKEALLFSSYLFQQEESIYA